MGILFFTTSCAALVFFFAGPLASAANILKVDCSKRSLDDAISKADPGDTLQVTGACRERIVVTIDRLTLDGQRAATLHGGGSSGGSFSGAIVIEGARGVTVRGFTIQNSSIGVLGDQMPYSRCRTQSFAIIPLGSQFSMAPSPRLRIAQ
jgi:nitrous oxidase accessory protein NosD